MSKHTLKQVTSSCLVDQDKYLQKVNPQTRPVMTVHHHVTVCKRRSQHVKKPNRINFPADYRGRQAESVTRTTRGHKLEKRGKIKEFEPEKCVRFYGWLFADSVTDSLMKHVKVVSPPFHLALMVVSRSTGSLQDVHCFC